MLVLVKQVGANYGVLDTDDGVLDWVSKAELLAFSKQVDIVGVNPSGKLEPTSTTITPDKCNWSKGQNIFKTIIELQVNGHSEFILTTEEGKKYKGTIIANHLTLYFKFNTNILVPICEQNRNLIAQLDFNNLSSELFNTLLANLRRGIV